MSLIADSLRTFLLECSASQVMFWGGIFFLSLYVSFALVTLFLSRFLLPLFSIGGLLDPRPIRPGQVWDEFTNSLGSVLVFGLGMVVPWGLIQLGWATLGTGFTTLQFIAEALVLVLWNEIHFYFSHRLLHTPRLRRFHMTHHHSIVVTPWSTYSFHPVEAIILGAVPLVPMVLYPFNALSLASLPFTSLFYNSIGHSNYDFLPWAYVERWWPNGSRRHRLHHISSQGNFGFMLPFMDQVFKTALPDRE